MNEISTKRRWYRWSLRTLFVLIAVAAWFAGQLNWKLQRRAFLAREGVIDWTENRANPMVRPSPPWPLWPVAERGVGKLLVSPEIDGGDAMARKLFPEAQIELGKLTPTYGHVLPVYHRKTRGPISN